MAVLFISFIFLPNYDDQKLVQLYNRLFKKKAEMVK
jgi:hypothetical protein